VTSDGGQSAGYSDWRHYVILDGADRCHTMMAKRSRSDEDRCNFRDTQSVDTPETGRPNTLPSSPHSHNDPIAIGPDCVWRRRRQINRLSALRDDAIDRGPYAPTVAIHGQQAVSAGYDDQSRL